jgi:hypothetical protein
LECGTATILFFAKTIKVETASLLLWGGKLTIGLRMAV